MGTSVFFNNYQSSREQSLIEELIIESIKIHGLDIFYCPRTIIAKDDIYNEDALSQYNSSYMVEVYVKNINGFGGDGDLFSKFGLEIRDQITFTIARRVFADEVGVYANIDRPQEGDIIFFPFNKKIFQIKFVEQEPVFYQMGSLQTYDLICELYEYSNEQLNTGIPEIDGIQSKYTIDLLDDALLTEAGEMLLGEDGYAIINDHFKLDSTDDGGLGDDVDADNEELQKEGLEIIDFTERDPFSEGEY